MPPNSKLDLTSMVAATATTATETDSSSRISSLNWEGEYSTTADDLFLITSYSDHERLAHGPRGKEAVNPISVYRFNSSDGSMVLVNLVGDKNKIVNPAFSRFHSDLNVVYTCTEDIESNGKIFAYSILPNGELNLISEADAGGTSTCYLTIDRDQKNILAVNYWDSTLAVIPISQETGEFNGPIKSMYDPKFGKKVAAAGKKHGGVNHSNNDDSTIRERQADPHSHALVLDPFAGKIAYVPDLGKDLIREFLYDGVSGSLTELNVIASGLSTGKPDGPRYFQFHPSLDLAYAVNELSSTIAVFSVDRDYIKEISCLDMSKESIKRIQKRSTLKLIQSISTIPSAFPSSMNTCGRICVHPTGKFVIVSNRGHQSIAIFRVTPNSGKLRQIGFFHTRGETPRHFQFDSSGQYLIVANQDTDTIAIFSFNLSSGEMKYTGNEYRVPSPNFVCCCMVQSSNNDCALYPRQVTIDHEIRNDAFLGHSKKSQFLDCRNQELQAELNAARKEIELLHKKLNASPCKASE